MEEKKQSEGLAERRLDKLVKQLPNSSKHFSSKVFLGTAAADPSWFSYIGSSMSTRNSGQCREKFNLILSALLMYNRLRITLIVKKKKRFYSYIKRLCITDSDEFFLRS